MYCRVQKSVKRNKSRRKTQFKPGHPCSYVRESKGRESSESRDESEVFTQLTSRMSSSEFPDVMTVSTSSQSSQSLATITYRLRRRKDKTYVETSTQRNIQAGNETIISNIKKLKDLFSAFVHSCESADSNTVTVSDVERKGLCACVSVTCKNCGFKTPKTGLFTTVKPQRGPYGGCINTMMVMPVVKSRVGLFDLNLVLFCLNVKVPSICVLQRKLNKLTDKIEEFNQKQMIENHQYVKRIQCFACLSNTSHIEYDVS